jgi:hypothetical protein
VSESRGASAGLVVERGVSVAMRDGVVLRADVYRPARSGRYPVLVERVAYELSGRAAAYADYYASRGYAVVAQNVRGTYESGGRYTLCLDDQADGYDTIEWAARQPWSNGRIGMLDGSYSGFTQYLAAAAAPPSLGALYAREGGGDVAETMAYRGGVPWLWALRHWILGSLVLPQARHPSAPPHLAAALPRLEAALAELPRWQRHLPLASYPPLDGLADWLPEMLAQPPAGPYWEPARLSRRYAEVTVPILHLGGWFDAFLGGTIRAFKGIRAHARSARARENQRLLIGPWVHGPANVGQRTVGEVDFGEAATEVDLYAHRLAWYDHWLKDEENGAAAGPPVRVFLMGANRWLDLPDWPPPGARATPIYFRAGTGRTDASLNNGTLALEPPRDEAPDAFDDDPEDPVPSLINGLFAGPCDHRSIEGRMLTYTSAPLERDLTVAGEVRAVLWGASSALDTDWVVRLCDVWPDGRSMSVCDGILRARYRHGLDRPELLEPNRPEELEVDLWSTAQVFAAGHRIRVEVAASDFPRYARNLHTGGPPEQESVGQVAHNTVFHDAARASHLVLPILDREG